jgi:hypothetical protein
MTAAVVGASTIRRSWIALLITSFLLGGCHARSGCCHSHSSCSDAGDGIVAAFYLFYILGWIIVAATEH